MDSTRAHALTQIMRIEDQVKKTARSKRYMKIQQYVIDLQNSSGSAIINIENPGEMGKIIQVRKNSDTAKKYLQKYELLLNEYTVLFNELYKRKKRLQAELFRLPEHSQN